VFTSRGYVEQDISNLEPLEYVNNLIATNVSIVVNARYSMGSANRIYDRTRGGTFGEGTGSAHVFQRWNETWTQVATLTGNDTTESIRFGESIAINEDVIVVGAVGANLNGVPEKQAIYCSANSGYFQIKFRGWQSRYIAYNVTRLELIDAIVSPTNRFMNLYSIVSIDIDEWGTSYLCNNNTAHITFYSPVDGNGDDHSGANLELLTLINVNLTNHVSNKAVLQIYETQKGSWKVHGVGADTQQSGAAYVYRDSSGPCNTSFCSRNVWLQEGKFFPLFSATRSRFGTSVAISDGVVVVGAPGSNDEMGFVYVYEYSSLTKQWHFLQFFTDPLFTKGDHFGHSLAIFRNTVVVGAPGAYDSKGSVHVYRRDLNGVRFIPGQDLPMPSLLSPLSNSGDLFGFSVSISKNTIVVGAPGYNDESSIYLGRKKDFKKNSDDNNQYKKKRYGCCIRISKKINDFRFRISRKVVSIEHQAVRSVWI